MKYKIRQVGIKHIDWVGLILSTEAPSQCKAIAMYLGRFMNYDQDVAWPSLTRISCELSLGRSTVCRSLKILEDDGWITREKGDSTKNTRYYISFPRVVEDFTKKLSSATAGLPSATAGLGVVPQRDTNKPVNKQYNNTFLEFWENYPRKDDKKKASKAFIRLTEEEQKIATEDCKTRYDGVNKKFIPLATTYLNGERWDDERDDILSDYSAGGI